MSLKDILDSFREGRSEAKEIFDDFNNHAQDEPLRKEGLIVDNQPADNNIPAYLRSYSRLENVAYAIGVFSRPKAVYEMVKLVFSRGSQVISEEEVKGYDEQKDNPNI